MVLGGQRADVNKVGDPKKGWTAMHVAARSGRLDIVEALLNSGGDPFVKDLKGNTPADIATKEGHVQLVSLLKRAGHSRRGNSLH